MRCFDLSKSYGAVTPDEITSGVESGCRTCRSSTGTGPTDLFFLTNYLHSEKELGLKKGDKVSYTVDSYQGGFIQDEAKDVRIFDVDDGGPDTFK